VNPLDGGFQRTLTYEDFAKQTDVAPGSLFEKPSSGIPEGFKDFLYILLGCCMIVLAVYFLGVIIMLCNHLLNRRFP
jgi:hypothetical protein